MSVRITVDKVVHLALPVERDVLGHVASDLDKSHGFKQGFKFAGLRVREFDKFEPISASYVEVVDLRLGGVVRKRSHEGLPSYGVVSRAPPRHKSGFLPGPRAAGASPAEHLI